MTAHASLAEPDESQIDIGRAEISSLAAETLASWDRTLAQTERKNVALVFARGAMEVMQRAAPHAAGGERQQVIDDLYEMGHRYGLDDDAVQTFIAVAADPPGIDPRSIAAASIPLNAPTPTIFRPITPASWKGTEPQKQRWLAEKRIPLGNLTILAGNGGSGKTEIICQLLVSVAAGLGDWLGCTVENGCAGFLSCEEDEGDIRERIERVCKNRQIDPHAIKNLHLQFPDIESDETWLATADRMGKIVKTGLFEQMEKWIETHKPTLFAIDSIAAVFDADAISRRQVRSFLNMLRRVARKHGTAIVLLDHPSVRGMADGTGTGNSVDWRNSVRSMLHLSDPEKNDPDARELEVKKTNRGRPGEKVSLRWNGLTFTTAETAAASPYRAAVDREVDELFLRLLEQRNAQGRTVTPNKAVGYAPKELAAMPGAEGFTAAALANAMERLLAAQRVTVETFGPPTKQRQRLIVMPSNRLPTGE